MSDRAPDRDDFAWFDEWVSNCPLATVTLVRDRNVEELAALFAAGREAEAVRRRSDRDPDPIGLGRHLDWAHAIEPSSTVGSTILKETSRGTEAAVLTFTATISHLLYGRDGTEVSGLDLVVRDIRYGQDPSFFENEINALEALPEPVLAARAGAEILRERLGLQLVPSMLNGDLRWI